jgi:putative peptide zinc metalloprotease protein
MARWQARLPLLVRQEGGEGFRLVEIPSSVAYLRQRPRRVPDEDWELAKHRRGVDGAPLYILKNRRTERFVQLTEAEKFLWEQMNGRASVQDLGTAYVLRFGSFDFEIIPALIRKLFSARLLRMPPASRLRAMLARNRGHPAARAMEAVLAGIERLTVASRYAHDRFASVYRYGGFLVYSPAGLAALVVATGLGIHGIRELWPHRHGMAETLADHPLVSLLLVKLFFWVTIILHQIVHALALPHYGRRVREFGFTMLHGFLPTFYADVTDLFMASRRARITAAVAGPMVHLFLGMLYFWIASMLAPGLAQAFLAATGLLQLQSLVVSLYPFWLLEMDGYHVLADLLGMPSLKEDSFALVRRGLRRGARFGREELFQLGYFALSVVSIVAFVALNVWLLVASW